MKSAFFPSVLGIAILVLGVAIAAPPIVGPGGSSGGFLRSITGDCSTSSNTGVASIICTKTNGVAFAASATTDTTNATHITSGTLNAARLPAPIANCSQTFTVATLPASGSCAFVSDSNATLAAGLGNIVAGSGSNFVPVYWDGTNWRIG